MQGFDMHLVQLAVEDPPRAIQELRALIAVLTPSEDGEALHACRDLLLSVFINQRTHLAEAEALAKALVNELPDAMHLRALARVYECVGRNEDALQLLSRAQRTANHHVDPELEAELERIK